MKRIESPSNPVIRRVRRIHRRKKDERDMLLEGKKLVEAAIARGTHLDVVLIDDGFNVRNIALPRDTVVTRVDTSIFRKLSTQDSPEGILAVAGRPSFGADALDAEGDLVVSFGIQDPGNLGAVARVAEAAGAAGMVIVKGSADPFSPKSLRGSMGSLLRIPVLEVDGLADVRGYGRRLAALVPDGGTDFRALPRGEPVAVVLGSESAGIDEGALRANDLTVAIPMKGAVESLNVATAAALVLYERIRPRP